MTPPHDLHERHRCWECYAQRYCSLFHRLRRIHTMLLVLSTKRVLQKWRAPAVLLLFILILWFASVSVDKHKANSLGTIAITTNYQEHQLQQSDTANGNANKHARGDIERFSQIDDDKGIIRGYVVDVQNVENSEDMSDNVNGIIDENVANEQVDPPIGFNANYHEKEIAPPGGGNDARELKSEEYQEHIRSKQLDDALRRKSYEKKDVVKELQEQEESFHQLPEFPLENPQPKEDILKNAQEMNWIAGVNSIAKFNHAIETIQDKSNILQRLHNKQFEKSNAIDSQKSPDKEKVEQEESFHQLLEHQEEISEDKYGSHNNWRNLTISEINKLSVLGRRLFLNEKIGQEQNKEFTIHIYKHKKHVARRLLKERIGSKSSFDPFEDCSVSNCRITWEDDDLLTADAVIFHLHRLAGPPKDVPRKPHQQWVWLSDESPYNVFMVSRDRDLSHYSGYFNWSMTYKMDADVPVPYGRTVPLPKDQYTDTFQDYFSEKPRDIAILGSNCGGVNHRYKYIKELQKYISVDVYGKCGPLKCPGHFHNDCPLLNDYKFYLSFENSNCDDYITEKVWWNALAKGAVPVVMGTTKDNYDRVLPPGSFIYAEDFREPRKLAEYLNSVMRDATSYNAYHAWRRHFAVVNEHGYFQSPIYHFCRLCEALNYNTRTMPQSTADLQPYFDRNLRCHRAVWQPPAKGG